MNEPLITVLMPVYNGSVFLKKAIDSVLAQSFTNFEFIIINDGSTDDSEKIIQAYTDSRIQHIRNGQNAGLIQTLNRGIDLAKGRYIARMDADDICMPQRLAVQKIFLETNSEISFVAATINIINEEGVASGIWALDRATISAQAIKSKLPFKNCIAHPSVMGRTEAFKKFKYKAQQLHTEDYDLWLRVLNSGGHIGKIAEPLLLYREHTASVTGTKLKKAFALIHYRMKMRFLTAEIKAGNITVFTFRVFWAMLLDGGTVIYKKLKRL